MFLQLKMRDLYKMLAYKRNLVFVLVGLIIVGLVGGVLGEENFEDDFERSNYVVERLTSINSLNEAKFNEVVAEFKKLSLDFQYNALFEHFDQGYSRDLKNKVRGEVLEKLTSEERTALLSERVKKNNGLENFEFKEVGKIDGIEYDNEFLIVKEGDKENKIPLENLPDNLERIEYRGDKELVDVKYVTAGESRVAMTKGWLQKSEEEGYWELKGVYADAEGNELYQSPVLVSFGKGQNQGVYVYENGKIAMFGNEKGTLTSVHGVRLKIGVRTFNPHIEGEKTADGRPHGFVQILEGSVFALKGDIRTGIVGAVIYQTVDNGVVAFKKDLEGDYSDKKLIQFYQEEVDGKKIMQVAGSADNFVSYRVKLDEGYVGPDRVKFSAIGGKKIMQFQEKGEIGAYYRIVSEGGISREYVRRTRRDSQYSRREQGGHWETRTVVVGYRGLFGRRPVYGTRRYWVPDATPVPERVGGTTRESTRQVNRVIQGGADSSGGYKGGTQHMSRSVGGVTKSLQPLPQATSGRSTTTTTTPQKSTVTIPVPEKTTPTIPIPKITSGLGAEGMTEGSLVPGFRAEREDSGGGGRKITSTFSLSGTSDSRTPDKSRYPKKVYGPFPKGVTVRGNTATYSDGTVYKRGRMIGTRCGGGSCTTTYYWILQ